MRPARPPGRLTRAQDTPNVTGPEWLTDAAPANEASDWIAAVLYYRIITFKILVTLLWIGCRYLSDRSGRALA